MGNGEEILEREWTEQGESPIQRKEGMTEQLREQKHLGAWLGLGNREKASAVGAGPAAGRERE